MIWAFLILLALAVVFLGYGFLAMHRAPTREGEARAAAFIAAGAVFLVVALLTGAFGLGVWLFA